MARAADGTRSHPPLTRVALPTEHGGWSLTLEPVILGLIVAPSWAGAMLGAVALLGFLIRTPLKISLGDRRRNRHLGRTAVADRIVAVEAAVLALCLAGVAQMAATMAFWIPILAATPLFAVELWFDVRSKGRHLLPELAGTIGIGSIATAIAMAGGTDGLVAWGLWSIAAARAIAAIPFVRVQLRRAKHQPFRRIDSDAAQAVAVAGIGLAALAGATTAIAAGAIGVLASIHVIQVRLPPPRAPVLGAQQVVLGLAVVVTSGLAAVAP